jgi:toxin ParE1/3/4
MAEIRRAPEIAEDFERILEHLRADEVADADARLDAIDVLERHQLIRRPTADGLYALVIGRQSRGFVALYHCLPEVDTFVVLAIQDQK